MRTIWNQVYSKPSSDYLKSLNPEFMGTVAGYLFYEHPEDGDESPLLVKIADGRFAVSHFWEVPDVEELIEFTQYKGMTRTE